MFLLAEDGNLRNLIHYSDVVWVEDFDEIRVSAIHGSSDEHVVLARFEVPSGKRTSALESARELISQIEHAIGEGIEAAAVEGGILTFAGGDAYLN